MPDILAPVVGIEPTTRGFGDRRSTIELHRYKFWLGESDSNRPYFRLTAERARLECYPRTIHSMMSFQGIALEESYSLSLPFLQFSEISKYCRLSW